MWGRVLALALLGISASGQFRAAPEHAKRMDLALQEALAKQTLPCDAEPTRAFLDFAFRFEIGYLVRCPLKEFGGVDTTIATYMRVQAADAAPVWFGQYYRVPGIPNDVRSKINLMRDRNDIEFSGVVGSGEGEYSVDLVVVDKQHRLFHRSWKTKAYARGGETRAPVSMQSNKVDALGFPEWSCPSSSHSHSRLTVLVDAAPIHKGSTQLRAWDRAFLMEALSSVLSQLPSKSVRVVAFNLDQQREVYRADNFSPEDNHRFVKSLDEVELGKVSYQVLQETQGASDLLLKLISQETEAEHPPDAVIFLGPTNRLTEKIPAEMASNRHTSTPIFYLKYSPIAPARFRMPLASIMGMRDDLSNDLATLEVGNDTSRGEFPDIIQNAASLHDGVTINIYSPAGLAAALKKIDHRLHSAVSTGVADK